MPTFDCNNECFHEDKASSCDTISVPPPSYEKTDFKNAEFEDAEFDSHDLFELLETVNIKLTQIIEKKKKLVKPKKVQEPILTQLLIEVQESFVKLFSNFFSKVLSNFHSLVFFNIIFAPLILIFYMFVHVMAAVESHTGDSNYSECKRRVYEKYDFVKYFLI